MSRSSNKNLVVKLATKKNEQCVIFVDNAAHSVLPTYDSQPDYQFYAFSIRIGFKSVSAKPLPQS